MIAEPKNPGPPKAGGLPSHGALSNAAGLPSRAEALALVERARRMRAETLAGMARAALAWIGGAEPDQGATIGCAVRSGSRSSAPSKGVPSSNQLRGAGAPQRVWR